LYHVYAVGQQGLPFGLTLGLEGTWSQQSTNEPWNATIQRLLDPLDRLAPETPSPVHAEQGTASMSSHGLVIVYEHFNTPLTVGAYASEDAFHVTRGLTSNDCNVGGTLVFGVLIGVEGAYISRFPMDEGTVTAAVTHVVAPPSIETYHRAFAVFLPLSPADPAYDAQSPFWSLLWSRVPVPLPEDVERTVQNAACSYVPVPY
jgi:hypothetical protein